MVDSETNLPRACAESLRERKRLETRNSIHEACLNLAEERGYTGFTVDEAAEKAGISRRTFFNYFSSKEDALFDFDSEDLPEEYRQKYLDETYATPECSVVLEMVRMYADVEQSRLVGFQPSRMRRIRHIIQDNPKLIEYFIKKADANFQDRSELLKRRHPGLSESQRLVALKTVESIRHHYIEGITDSEPFEYGSERLIHTYDELMDVAFQPFGTSIQHNAQEKS
ncbi:MULTISPECIES: TetR/AcrR family transcriptional regulator [Kocuria]|uniref:TetR/AcrR family transcriptional regulator n=1 Tax=Kocuria TaxID=57493 RepID=UPI001EE89243|nr:MULTISPECIES: TetR/AcrR family transcriptional regulator [Kocuria]